jgi:hypothetical protein
VLETLGAVYGYDDQAREQGLSPEERLGFHQEDLLNKSRLAAFFAGLFAPAALS